MDSFSYRAGGRPASRWLAAQESSWTSKNLGPAGMPAILGDCITAIGGRLNWMADVAGYVEGN